MRSKNRSYVVTGIISIVIACLYILVDLGQVRSCIVDVSKSVLDGSAEIESWERPVEELTAASDLVLIKRQPISLSDATRSRINSALRSSSVEFEIYLPAIIGAGESISSRSDIRIIGDSGDEIFLRSDRRIYVANDTSRVFWHSDLDLWQRIEDEILDQLDR